MTSLKGIPVILFNGPPGAGKDTGRNILGQGIPGMVAFSFGERLKSATHDLYGCGDLGYDFFDGKKDTPNENFYGRTPREAYIEFARVVEAILGEDFFAKALISVMESQFYMRGNPPTAIIISDLGFKSEADTIIEAFGVPSVLIVRVHAEKRGCTFDGDSRRYIDARDTPPFTEFLDIENNDLDDTSKYQANLLMRVGAWLEGRRWV